MKELTFGEKLQFLRKDMGYSQKDFAQMLNIPQPSLSAYENNHNSPTKEVLINIAKQCHVSLDWLCGLTSSQYEISQLGDICEIIKMLFEINEISLDVEINDKFQNDIETEDNKWYAQIRVYGHKPNFKYNSALCDIIHKISDNFKDLECYAISKEIFDAETERMKSRYNNYPLTKKQFPELSRDERLKKYREYINKSLE